MYSLRETTFCDLRHTDQIGLALDQTSPITGPCSYMSRIDDTPCTPRPCSGYLFSYLVSLLRSTHDLSISPARSSNHRLPPPRLEPRNRRAAADGPARAIFSAVSVIGSSPGAKPIASICLLYYKDGKALTNSLLFQQVPGPPA